MTDPAPDVAPPEVSPPEAAAPRWRWRPPAVDWRAKARWFGAEYLIVVLGVLTAVGINAWWGDRQDRDREAEYLRQLAVDVELTLLDVDRTDEVMREGDRASLELVRAFQNAAPPPKDSLLAWLYALSYNESPTIVTRTADALIATGDLRLIRDDSVRQSVTLYVDLTDTLLDYIESNGEARSRATNAFLRRIDQVEMSRAAGEGDLPEYWVIGDTTSARPMAVRFPADPAALLADRGAYDEAWDLSVRRNFLKLNREAVRRETLAFRDLLERRTADR